MVLRFLCANRAACQDQVHSQALARDASQADCAAVYEGHTETAVEDSEDSVPRGDAQIAPERELDPASHAVAFDSSDHRLAESEVRHPHRAVAVADLGPSPFSERLQVKAGTEVAARSGQNGDTKPGIGVKAPKCSR